VELRGPAHEVDGVGRQLDAGDRVGLAKDDTVEVEIEVHLVPHTAGRGTGSAPRYDAPPRPGNGRGCVYARRRYRVPTSSACLVWLFLLASLASQQRRLHHTISGRKCYNIAG
jgi:hypothetical protein